MKAKLSVTVPKQPGWYWFRPTDKSPTPTGFLRLGQWVVVLVGPVKFTRDGPPGPLVVRFPQATYTVEDLQGEWSERLVEPSM